MFDVMLLILLDVEFGYPGRPLLFDNLNFGVDLDSRSISSHAV